MGRRGRFLGLRAAPHPTRRLAGKGGEERVSRGASRGLHRRPPSPRLCAPCGHLGGLCFGRLREGGGTGQRGHGAGREPRVLREREAIRPSPRRSSRRLGRPRRRECLPRGADKGGSIPRMVQGPEEADSEGTEMGRAPRSHSQWTVPGATGFHAEILEAERLFERLYEFALSYPSVVEGHYKSIGRLHPETAATYLERLVRKKLYTTHARGPAMIEELRKSLSPAKGNRRAL